MNMLDIRFSSPSTDRLRAVLALINGAKQVKHSDSSLWDHLIGTYQLLTRWGAPPHVGLAGLIHSIYATQYFQEGICSLEDRHAVAAVAGTDAEQLAHAFCTLDREALRQACASLPPGSRRVKVAAHGGGRPMSLSWPTYRALRLIDIANELEQSQRPMPWPALWLSWVSHAFAEIDFIPAGFNGHLPRIESRQEHKLLALYRQGLASKDASASISSMSACVQLVPCSAEPHIVLAGRRLAEADFAAAYAQAHTGLAYLRAWGCTWDPRLPMDVWEILATQLMTSARAAHPRRTERLPALFKQCMKQLQKSGAAPTA